MKSDKKLLIVKILSILYIYPLLPCIWETIDNIVWHLFSHTHIPDWPFQYLYWFFIWANITCIFLRIFYLIYIIPVVLMGVYLYLLIKNKLAIKEWIIFVVILIIIILGLLSVESLFWAAMGI